MKSGENGLIGPGDNDYGRKFNSYPWTSVADALPKFDVKVIVTEYRVPDHPEHDNQHITYLTKDCNSGQLKWAGGTKPNPVNEFWMKLPEPPLKK